MHHTTRQPETSSRILLLAALTCALGGCEVLGSVARVSDDQRCEREARTYDDQKACKARQKSLDDYEDRRKSKDEELRLGPKKAS